MIEYHDGELSEVDEANIPVNIFINKPGEDDEYPDKWVLTADNFMPRKNAACAGCVMTADSLQELQEEIKKYVLPLYQTAITQIGAMIDATEDMEMPSLYYWESEA